MTMELAVALAVLTLAGTPQSSEGRPVLAAIAPAATDTVHVAAPTGERDADRTSILVALAAVQDGGTIQFAAGTYLIGEMISVTVPEVTLLGHPEGTTLQGCREGLVDPDRDTDRCNGLELAGARQTVRGFTIQDVNWGIHLGCCWEEKTTYTFIDGSSFDAPAFYRTAGGHLVEGNTIVRAASGIRVNGDWSEPAVVRGNRFVDSWHAVSINGHTVHLLDNEITVPEPERVPFWGFPWDGVKISPTPPLQGVADQEPHTCVGNVVAGNRIDGHLDGIRIELYFPGTRCTGNIVRDNTIVVQRVKNPRPGSGFTLINESDSTFVGVPISLLNGPVAFGWAEPDGQTTIEENVIEGNRILGGDGLGIQVLHASRNRIAGNTIRGITVRDPFPGNTMGVVVAEGAPLPWETANGSGIWISPGSEANLLEGNVFEGIAHASVVREGEVETDDGVRLYYRVEGEGPDTVVVLHGGPSLGHAYLAPDLVRLDRGRAVVHYDQRGIGRSSPLSDPERLSIERHVQDLDALRAHLGLERLALLGHSWGGMLAARYAAAHPERVDRILLLDPMAPARDPFMAMAGARAQELFRARLDETARARLDSLAATAEVADPGALCRERFSLLTRSFFEDPAAAARSRADFCGGTPETLRIREEVDAAILGSLGAWDVRPTLGHVRSPVLVVRGAEGAIPLEAMEAWAEAFPNARLITIARAGHYLHVDRPDVFFPAAEIFFGGGWPEAEAFGAGDVPVQVAMPTGETETDRANVQAAFDSVQPGGTVQFAPGTYLLGEGIWLTVPDVTVLGHPAGTVLRGCDPEAFAVEYSDSARERVALGCTGLLVKAERQTIRGLTFEYTWSGIEAGHPDFWNCGEDLPDYRAGGQRIEGNTFRKTPNALGLHGTGTELSVVRDNDITDVFHAIQLTGGPVHFLDNRITIAEPESVPFARFPGSAILVSPAFADCSGHVVAGNRIVGYPDPIYVMAYRGTTCSGVEIRDNEIHAARVKVPAAFWGYRPTEHDSTMVGVAITLMNSTRLPPHAPPPLTPEAVMAGVLEDILVQGNRIVGGEGLGILIQGVSRSRIADNVFTGIRRRTPFPGLTWDGAPSLWQVANGSAIWLSPGSDENEIAGNTFVDIAACAIHLTGDRNVVETRTVRDEVCDLGAGNQVRGPNGTVPRNP